MGQPPHLPAALSCGLLLCRALLCGQLALCVVTAWHVTLDANLIAKLPWHVTLALIVLQADRCDRSRM